VTGYDFLVKVKLSKQRHFKQSQLCHTSPSVIIYRMTLNDNSHKHS